ncbi:ROK family protein [Metabacillus indicus]|uniref:ROK family protein n=1 Tax=Metabacillus indicus TaxID=246786 RepID=UPI003983EEDA
MSLRIGIDLGGTNVRVGLIDDNGKIVEIIQEPTEAEQGPLYIIEKMKRMIESVIQGKRIKGIGIGAPGPLDSKNGIILSPPNLPGWDQIPLAKILEEHFRVSVYLNNDANVAGLAEANAGSGANCESVYYVTVSTGIGGALIINKQLFNGANGYAGEIGNMIVEPNGYKHNNLNSGSFEGIASGTSIGRRAFEKFGIEGGAKQVFRLAEHRNAEAQLIIDETVHFLAMGIANIAHIVNPELFIVGGGVMESKQLILTPLKDKVKEYVFPQLASSIRIVPAALGGHAGVIGAAMLVD